MGEITGIEWYKSEEKALEYYTDRVEKLIDYYKQLKNCSFFIESDDLVNNTEHTLKELSNWLQLEPGLSQKYRLFDDTGLEGSGDPGENIKKGMLSPTKVHEDINITEEIIERGRLIYNKFITLQRNQLHIAAQ
jgi:hypothetical protein